MGAAWRSDRFMEMKKHRRFLSLSLREPPMLQLETLPGSLSGLLLVFRSCFTAPTFRTFVALVSGLVAQPVSRTVCGMLVGAGLSRLWHHSRAHWFFARARWSVEQVGLALLGLIVDRLIPPGVAMVVAVDDTLFRRSGRKVHAAGWHHDGSAKGPRRNRVSWGNCWVIAGVVVELPFLDRPVCLPVAFALWRKAGASKQVIACRLVTTIATAALPGRQIHLVADAWYAGADGAPGAGRGACRERGLPANVTLTSRLRVNATLHDIAEPTPGRPGRPRRIGDKIGTPATLANRSQWTPTVVRRYGRTDPVTIAEHRCLWYGVYRSRTVRVILLRDADTVTGYDLALITTDLTNTAELIIARYAARWSIEVAIEDAKQITGVGEARNRAEDAVNRTVPFGLITQSLVVIWYTLHGHTPDDAANRRAQAPWYRTKTQPAYQDMIIKLRRTLIAAKFRGGRPYQPTPQETLAVQLAWAEAAA
jgi:DDE superfamily endonuclease